MEFGARMAGRNELWRMAEKAAKRRVGGTFYPFSVRASQSGFRGKLGRLAGGTGLDSSVASMTPRSVFRPSVIWGVAAWPPFGGIPSLPWVN